MKRYTLVLSIEDCWGYGDEPDEKDLEYDINDYTRGIFTSYDKAEEIANKIMRGEIEDTDDVKEISIVEFEEDTFDTGLCVVSWALVKNNKWFKYFEHKNGKIVSYRYHPEMCKGCPNLIETEESVFCKCDEDSTLGCPNDERR